MDTSTALKRASEHGGPIVLGGGMTLLAVALFAGTGHAPHVAAQPAPTTTTTVTAAPSPVAANTTSTPAGSAQIPRVTTVSDRGSYRLNPGSAHKPHSAAPPRATSRPSPAPQAPASCTGRLLALHLLDQCVSLGGTP